jgi:hypothetical protein
MTDIINFLSTMNSLDACALFLIAVVIFCSVHFAIFKYRERQYLKRRHLIESMHITRDYENNQ